MRKRKSLRFTFLFLAIALITNSLVAAVAFASPDYSYSLEDVYEAFAIEPTLDTSTSSDPDADVGDDKIKGDYTLPSWNVLRQEIVKEESVLTLSGDSYNQAINRINIAKAITTGFQKSSKWAKFKDEVDKICSYKKDTGELVINSVTTTTERKFYALLEEFDKAMLIASVSAMTDISKTSSSSKFVVIVGNISDLLIGTLGVVTFEIGRISMSCAALMFIAELLFIGVEPLRPVLGFETQPKLFKKLSFRGEELGADYSRTFRIVGVAARAAVAKEYEIQGMNEVHKNSILVTYIWGKLWYLIAMVFGIAIIDSKIWGSLCVSLMSAVMGLF